MTTEAAIGKAAHALLGLGCTILAKVLPWSGRSMQDVWHNGYRDGSREGFARGYVAGQQAKQ